jgi:5'(3')-deoxyribonucleotidase
MTGDAFVLGVDLDGVVADFYAAVKPLAAEWFGIAESSLPSEFSYGLPEWGFSSRERYDEFHRFAVTERELFWAIEPLSGAGPALRRLSQDGVHIRIITHRLFVSHLHQKQASQTIGWLDHHGIPYRDLCFMKDKAAVGADMYIDDAPDNVSALRDIKPTIVFSNSTNLEMEPPRAEDWVQAEALVREELRTWRGMSSEVRA